jgi:hypothetical protein
MMTRRTEGNWLQLNQSYLALNLERLRLGIQAQQPENQPTQDRRQQLKDVRNQIEKLRLKMNPAPALDSLCAAFGLTEFERDLLLLGAGVELEAVFAKAVASCNAGNSLANFALALSVLENPHWSALTATAPLRRWRLIDLNPNDGFITSSYAVPERILHYLAGVDELDLRVTPYLQELPPQSPQMSPQYAAEIEHLAHCLTRDQFNHLVQLYSDNWRFIRFTVSLACQVVGLRCFRLLPGLQTGNPVEIEAFARLWEREAVLSRACLLVELDDSFRPPQLVSVLNHFKGAVIFASTRRLSVSSRKVVVLEAPKTPRSDLTQFWRQHTAPWASSLNGFLEQIVDQFRFSFEEIQNVSTQLTKDIGDKEPEQIQRKLWHACRIHARQNMDGLAQRIKAIATWQDLILPEPSMATLKQIAEQVRHRRIVYDRWGFRQKSNRGFGISALFTGDSGTGKTMAAEVIANELELDLYRIDLSQVVSKYIGETEKNLKRVFDAAEHSGAILLFDEADALFGKRSEVKDSHDRYANIEISFLLQRMEAYSGLAILTTNLRKTIDNAFLRRLRFVVQFPFPDSRYRRQIWQQVLPDETPAKDLEYHKLARLNIAGGNIRNIALNAAFIAAKEKQTLTMEHILEATRSEYIKMDKLLNDTKWRGSK